MIRRLLVLLFALLALATFGAEGWTHYTKGAALSFVMLGVAGLLGWLAGWLADRPDTEAATEAALAKCAALKAALTGVSTGAGGGPPTGGGAP